MVHVAEGHALLNQGVQGFVFQDNAKTELVPAIEEVLGGGTYV